MDGGLVLLLADRQPPPPQQGTQAVVLGWPGGLLSLPQVPGQRTGPQAVLPRGTPLPGRPEAAELHVRMSERLQSISCRGCCPPWPAPRRRGDRPDELQRRRGWGAWGSEAGGQDHGHGRVASWFPALDRAAELWTEGDPTPGHDPRGRLPRGQPGRPLLHPRVAMPPCV